MRCEDVMWRDPPVLAPDETARAAAQKLVEANVGALPVVGADGRFLGLVTERALVQRVLAEDLDPTLATMSLVADARVPACEPDDPAAVALKRMDEGNYRWLPVVQHGRFLGLVGARDIRSAARTEDVHGLHSVTDAALRH